MKILSYRILLSPSSSRLCHTRGYNRRSNKNGERSYSIIHRKLARTRRRDTFWRWNYRVHNNSGNL